MEHGEHKHYIVVAFVQRCI